MADHYLIAVRALEEAHDLRLDLEKLYRTPKSEMGPHGPIRPSHVQVQINAGEAKYRHLMTEVKAHGYLAVRQELQEIANRLPIPYMLTD